MKDTIRQLIQQALDQLAADGILPAGLIPDIQMENTKDYSHGDFASNIAMMLAKPAGIKPRDLVVRLVEAIPAHEQLTKVEIAGPGFLNFFQNHVWLAASLNRALADERLGVRKAGSAQRAMIGLSSPNLTKEMHVGHLRSIVIGDTVARVLEFLDDTVIRQNHVGDWGTQLGMLLAYLEEQPVDAEAELHDLEAFYRTAKKRLDESPEFADRARELVTRLQVGDPDCLRLWTRFNEISLSHCQEVYDRLGMKLSMTDVTGEGAYNDDLAQVVADLTAKGLLTEDNNALCVFLEEFRNAEGNPLPVIVQKAGGGYLYTTTDLTAMRYRRNVLHADHVLYFIDQHQALHFQQVFEVTRCADFVPADMELEHMGFGIMNGADGRPLKTRDGSTVKLIDLLEEAESRAYALVKERSEQRAERGEGPFGEVQLHEIGRVVGIDSVEYADLSKHRTSDYSFSSKLMLSFEGDTAPYLLYARTRVASAFRKLGQGREQLGGKIVLEQLQELALAAQLAQFSDLINNIAFKGVPHLLCAYLCELAGPFSSFYEHRPVLTAEDPARKNSHLRLTALTGRTLEQGLELLGLKTLECM